MWAPLQCTNQELLGRSSGQSAMRPSQAHRVYLPSLLLIDIYAGQNKPRVESLCLYRCGFKVSWDHLYVITKKSPLAHSFTRAFTLFSISSLAHPNTTLSPAIPGKFGRSPLLTSLCFHVDVPSQYRIRRSLCWRGWCIDILGSWRGFAWIDNLSSREVKVSLTLLSVTAWAKKTVLSGRWSA